MSVGRISGPLLKANLLREGIDLAFDSDLLYLDVTNRRIGINTVNPSHDLTVTGTIRTTNLEATTRLDIDQISITGNTISSNFENLNLLPANNGVVYQSQLTIDDFTILDNEIAINTPNQDFIISTLGTGILQIEASSEINGSLNVDGNLTVTGTTTLSGDIEIGNSLTDTVVLTARVASDIIPSIDNTYDIGNSSFLWKDMWVKRAYISDIEISDNYIQITKLNTDLEIRGNGTGLVKVEDISIKDNVISTDTNVDLVLKPTGTGVVLINSTTALQLPKGTTAERPSLPISGMIRYNTDNENYEGFDGTYWRVLNGVSDVDQDTFIVAESTPGANDDTIYFFANGVQIADLTSARLNVSRIEVDNIIIDDNQITTVDDTTLNILSAGTGVIRVDNFEFKNNTIKNRTPNSVTLLQNTESGYFKIAGTLGFVIPIGTSSQRPVTPEVGFVRYNTTETRVEIFDGVTWTSTAGSATGVTAAAAEELAILTTLMLG
jgi:hypothetical protein